MKDLKHLVIKPIVYCALSCSYCEARQEHFDLTKECVLGVDNWAKVFKDADDLGVEYLDISGGEPSLYKYLDALVWEGKNKGWFVSVNSSGTGINKNLIQKLEDVCLDQIIISIMSINEENHDSLRGTQGSFQSANNAIQLIKDTSIRLVIHFIISKDNFRELPKIIEKSIEWGASSLALIYPENDFSEKSLLLNEDNILEMNKKIKVEATNSYHKNFPKRKEDIKNIQGLYPLKNKNNFAKGIFWDSLEEVKNKCDKPNQFVLIYTNGDVLPCNAVEYTKNPIMGNVLNDSLKEIWDNEKFKSFRIEKMNFCLMCPVKRHTGLSIAREDNPPYTAKIIKKVPKKLSSRPYVDEKFLKSKISNVVSKSFSNKNLILNKNATFQYKVYFVTEWWFPKIGGLERSIEYLSNALFGKIDFEILTLYRVNDISDPNYVHRFVDYEEISQFIMKNSISNQTIIHIFGFSHKFLKVQLNFIDKMKDLGYKIMFKIPTSLDATKNLKYNKNIINKIDYYLSLNRFITDELIDVGVEKNKIVNISNTVPTDLFTPSRNTDLIKMRNRFNLDLKKPIICFSGRFVRRKRLDLIIDAIEQISQKEQPILLFVGDVDNTFNDAFELKNMNKNYIRILPFQKNMTLIYKGIDAYISASELEGMSNSCLEAMSSGVPLIVSDISGQKEFIGKNREGGWIFKKGDVFSLKLAIESFYREWKLDTIDKKKSWVRKMAVKKYDSRLWAQRYEILYNSLILSKKER